jgi:hypothetical protein
VPVSDRWWSGYTELRKQTYNVMFLLVREQKLIELYVGFLINSLNHNRTSRNTNAALPSPKFKLLLFVVFCFLLSHFRTFLAADVKDMVQYPADSEYYDNLK